MVPLSCPSSVWTLSVSTVLTLYFCSHHVIEWPCPSFLFSFVSSPLTIVICFLNEGWLVQKALKYASTPYFVILAFSHFFLHCFSILCIVIDIHPSPSLTFHVPRYQPLLSNSLLYHQSVCQTHMEHNLNQWALYWFTTDISLRPSLLKITSIGLHSTGLHYNSVNSEKCSSSSKKLSHFVLIHWVEMEFIPTWKDMQPRVYISNNILKISH